MKLFIITGESGSGKTTLVNALTTLYPKKFKKVVTYTSRVKRINEIEGEDYFFVSQEYFQSHKNELILIKETKDGFYGTPLQELYTCNHNLLLTSGASAISKLLDKKITNLTLVTIEISEELKILRMRDRGDSEQIIRDRMITDQKKVYSPDLFGVPIITLQATSPVIQNASILLRHITI